jgi:hypothetical protein
VGSVYFDDIHNKVVDTLQVRLHAVLLTTTKHDEKLLLIVQHDQLEDLSKTRTFDKGHYLQATYLDASDTIPVDKRVVRRDFYTAKLGSPTGFAPV